MEKIYFIHGLMGTSDYHFKPQLQALQKEYEIIKLDLPGHGSNVEPVQESYFQQALSWVYKEIERTGRGHIVGLSLGASVAIHLAMKHPELCASIVLTGYAPAVPANMEEVMEEQYEMFLNIEENNPEVAKEFKDLHGDKWFETLKVVIKEMTFHYPTVVNEQVQKLSVPTLILNGADEQLERHAANDMADLNKNIQIGLIPGAGHIANLQQPDVYNIILKSFWNRLDAV